MRHLNHYIFENIDDLLDYLGKNSTFNNFSQKKKDLIEYTIKGDDKIIKPLLNTHTKIKENSKEIIINCIMEKMPDHIDKNKGHKKAFVNAILSLCEEYNCYDQVTYLCEQQMNHKNNYDSNSPFIHLNFNEILTINKIYEYYKEYFKNIKEEPICKEFWKSLIDKDAAGEPVIGKGEFLLRFISDIPSINPGGDVQINGIGIEVKNISENEAKLGNNKKGSTRPIFKFLNEVAKKIGGISEIEYKGFSKKPRITDSTENIKKVINNINDIEYNNLVQILSKSLEDEFYKDNTKIHKFDEKYRSVIEITINNLKNIKIEKDFSEFIRIFTALYISIYCGEENSKYLCVIKNDKSNDITFEFIDATDIDKLFNNVQLPTYRIRKDGTQDVINIQ